LKGVPKVEKKITFGALFKFYWNFIRKAYIIEYGFEVIQKWIIFIMNAGEAECYLMRL
jgi:hypothetical protein